MIIQINRLDVPIIGNILGGADIDRMNGIEVQAVKGRKEWNDGLTEFSSKGMKKGDKFYFVPFCNIYGMAEDVGFDIFEKLYGISDALSSIFVAHNVARVISDDEWRFFDPCSNSGENIPLACGGGYILKIKEENFPALSSLWRSEKNVMQGLIVQAWGVERGKLKYCFSEGYRDRKMTFSSRIKEDDAAFYVPMDNLLNAVEEKDPDAMLVLKKAFGVVDGLNFALSDVAELYLPSSSAKSFRRN